MLQAPMIKSIKYNPSLSSIQKCCDLNLAHIQTLIDIFNNKGANPIFIYMFINTTRQGHINSYEELSTVCC